jgi:hypothetical protein
MNQDVEPAEKLSRTLLWGLLFYCIAFLFTQIQTAMLL